VSLNNRGGRLGGRRTGRIVLAGLVTFGSPAFGPARAESASTSASTQGAAAASKPTPPVSSVAPKTDTGQATGTVVDDHGPVPGATVMISGGALKAPLGAISDKDGVYKFPGLKPGEYRVTVTFAGGRPIASPPFTIVAGEQTRVPPVSVYVETVKVEASTENLVETSHTTLGNEFKAEQIEDLPTGRSYTDVVNLTAGVQTNDGTGGVAAYGSTGLESNYQIDGMNSTSVGSGRPSTQVHFDIIKEIQVKTGGYGAEYGGAQGALVNVVTKSGGDRFEGSLAYYSAPDSLAASTETNGFDTQLPAVSAQEIAGSLGGYLLKDKVFFYAGVSHKSDSKVADQSFGDLFGRQEAESTEDRDLRFFKTTWQIDPQSQVVATFLADPGTLVLRDALGGTGGDHSVEDGGKDGSLTYTRLVADGKFHLEGRIGIHGELNNLAPTDQQQLLAPIGATRRDSTPSVRARCKDINDPYCLGESEGLTATQTFGEPSLRFGPYPYSGETNAARRSAALNIGGLLGKHDVKFGLGYENADFHQTLNYGWGTGMSLEWLPVTSPQGDPTRPPVSIVGVRRCWGDGEGNCRQWNDQVIADGGTKGASLYMQDSWTQTPTVTLNYGLRWDLQEILDNQGQSLVRMEHNLAPRLGATWDFAGNGTSKLYASWGRYYDQVPMQVVSRAFSPRITSTRLYRAENWSRQGFINDINQTGICPVNDVDGFATCWDFESKDLLSNPNSNGFDLTDKVHTSKGYDPNAFNGGLFPDTIVDSGSNYRAPIDPDLHGAHTDETLLGYEWSFRPNWKAGALVIKRDLGDAIEDMSLDFGKNFIIANPGGPYKFVVDPQNRDMFNPDYVPGSTDQNQQPGFAQIAGCAPGKVCTLTNDDLRRLGFDGFPRATRRFDGVQFEVSGQARKRLWMSFTYLRSQTIGNYRGRYFVESEERDPNLTEAFDVPALVVNADGPLPQDQENQVKLFGNVTLTPNASVGVTYRFTSGGPYSATTDPTGGSTPFFGPLFLLQRGTAGRLPSQHGVDLGFAHNIKDEGALKVSLTLDVFNALNEQHAVGVDEQFMATGTWSKPFPDGFGGVIFDSSAGSRVGRGEPLLEYVDATFGNGDGNPDRAEWNNWAQSFQGRFKSLDDLYNFLRTETVTLNQFGETFVAPAYPGFAGCAATLKEALQEGCTGINSGFGRSRLLESPRSIRLGIRMTF
jgi:hypothetical protein